LTPNSKFQQLKSALDARGLKPRKAFGQNFMLDTNFAAAIARDAAPDEHTLILEVGPGTGCLTRAILDAHPAARVLAIELDRGLAGLLRETFAADLQNKRLTLLEGDVLAGKHEISPEFVAEALAISAAENRPRRVLCTNLPYNVATPLLANLALDECRVAVSSAVATVQLELAQRLLAKPGESSYGALSALIALRAHGKILRKVGNEVFWPRPGVDSAVIGLTFKPWPKPGESPMDSLSQDEAVAFQQFVQKAFSQRRKMLRVTLKPAVIPKSLNISANARAEELSPAQLLELFRAM